MHSKIRHNIHIPKVVPANEVEYRYNNARQGHDSGVMTHGQMDRRDPHMKSSEPKPEQNPAAEGE